MKNTIEKLAITIGITILGTTLICGASFSAKLYLEPSSGKIISGCPNPIRIMLDTEDTTTNTVDVKIIDDESFTINSITDKGAIFGSYTKSMQSKIRQGKNKGKNAIYMLGTNPGIGRFNGDGIFATINIVPKAQIGENININFYMIPNQNGDDSNVSIIQGEKIIDTLDKATGGEYIITKGECPILNTGYNENNKNELKKSEYYLNHIDELEEKNILFTTETQERIKIQTKLVNKSKIEIFWINLLNFFKTLFNK